MSKVGKNMEISRMVEYEFPEDVISIWSNDKNKIYNLLPIQVEAIEKGLFDGENLLVVAPTSSGKTFIGELAALHYSYEYKKSLYLVPFKAIAEEKYDELNEKYSELGFSIKISDKDHREHDEDIKIGNYDIAILTYEKLAGMLIATPSLLNNCDCVVVDEVQMLGDSQRGGNLELLLTKIKESYSKTQIIALSAVLGNLNGFDRWLNASLIQVEERPVELRQGILFSNGIFEYKEWNSKTTNQEVINASDLNGLLRYLLQQDEQIIIIKNSVPSTQKLANELAKGFSSLQAASRIIGELQDEPESETRDALLATLRSSIAFHNSDCELNERRIIEKGFRDGIIKIIVSTTTLSMGVNLPCRTVILADHQKWDTTHETLQKTNWTVGEVRNIFGRAGRLGKNNEFGRGIFIANTSREKESIRRLYLDAPLEALVSAFENRDISLRVLDVVASGFGSFEEDIVNFIFKTFAAQSWTHQDAKDKILPHIRRGIDNCLTNELIIYTNQGEFKITEIGKICASMGCSIETFISLKMFIETTDVLNITETAFIVSQLEEVNKMYYRGINWDGYEFRSKIQNRLNDEHQQGELHGKIFEEYEKMVSRGNAITNSQLMAYTFALLAKDILLSDEAISHIKKVYGFSTANIRNITANMSWLLEICSKISAILKPHFEDELNKLNSCLINKSPLKCNYLNKFSILLREDRIRLVNSGILTTDDFLDKDLASFKGIINPTKVSKIIKSINDKRERNSQFWERDHINRLERLGLDTEVVKSVYKASGIPLEHEVCRLLDLKFINCVVNRVAGQSKGEPDILMMFEDGERIAVQVTAKEDITKFIDSKKAGDVIPQSARMSPSGYICLGRPDFQELAVEQSHFLAQNFNFKLLPLYALVELYVRVKEGLLSPESTTDIVKNSRGYINITMINQLQK
jgi:replicative superfamily II helicase